MRRFTAFLFVLFSASLASGAEIVYSHSFRLPALAGINFTAQTFNSSTGPLAIRPETGGVVIRGHARYPECVEVTIAGPNEVAKVAGPWFDPAAGLAAELTAATKGTQGYFLRSMCISDDDQIAGTVNEYYNVSGVDRAPFFRGDASLGGRSGPWNGGQHSLRLAEYLSPLSPQLRKHFRCRWAGGNSVSQGSGTSNQGPSLYVFDFPEKSFLPYGVFRSTPVIQFVDGNRYAGWHQSSLVRSMHCLADEVIWTGCKGTGATWYGEGTVTLSDGRVVTDKAYPTRKGWHAEGYQPLLWRCTNASIIAGQAVITEFDLSQWCTLGKGSELSSTYDAAGRRLLILDPMSDAGRPVIRVFSVK